jgi:glycerate kinase
MKIVIAPDAFKGSLSAREAAYIMKEAAHGILPQAEVHMIPMADGGEGTLDALVTAATGKQVPVQVTGPLGEKLNTSYGLLADGTAVIEAALISGLVQVPEEKRNPDNTTTYGIGEVIIDALNEGCTSFLIGIGGSATNDGGFGMLKALGMTAKTTAGKPLGPYGRDLLQTAGIDFSGLDERLKHARIQVASDVTNPLIGHLGASAVYGPQKGATPSQVEDYDRALDTFSDLVEAEVSASYKNIRGAGAAGGLGFALLALGAELSSGAELIGKAAGLQETMQGVALVLTGEGQSDEQTLYGKAPGHVAALAAEENVPAILISGSITGNTDKLRETFAGCFSILQAPISLDDAMKQAKTLLYEQTKQVIHLIYSLQRPERRNQ